MTCDFCGSPAEPAYPGTKWCPKCHRIGERIRLAVSETQILSAEEYQGLMEHKAYYESRADEVKTGELQLKEKGPLEFRPKFEKTIY